jgi:ketosteroid isomerase-like protein
MPALLRYAKAVAIVATTLLIAVGFGYGSEPRLEGDAKRSAEVWSSYQSWLQAYKSGDIAGVMAIFDRDVVFSFQGSKDQLYADLQRGYEVDLKARTPGTIWVPLVEQVYADNNLAFVRAVWELRVSGAAGSVEVKVRNQSLDVLRNVAGHWRIIRSINYPDKP